MGLLPLSFVALVASFIGTQFSLHFFHLGFFLQLQGYIVSINMLMLTAAADIGITLLCSAESGSEGSSEGSDANSQSVSITRFSLSSFRLIFLQD